MITRKQILDAITHEAKETPWMRALWEGGSAAFGRADEWSDIDVQLLVEDAHVAEAYSRIEKALAALSPLTDLYAVPEPTWHGQGQRFYRLRDASEFQMIDCVVIRKSTGPMFLEKERHGSARVLVDKDQVVVAAPLDHAALAAQRQARLAAIKASFPMFQTLITKEFRRGRPVDAMAFYMSQTIRPLIELLRIAHQPERFDFGLRYTKEDLPRSVHDRLASLLYVSDLRDMEKKHQDAVRLYEETLATLRD